jgi:hypothetical protein
MCKGGCLTRFEKKRETRECVKETVSQDLKKMQDSGVNVNVKHSFEVSRYITLIEVCYFFSLVLIGKYIVHSLSMG